MPNDLLSSANNTKIISEVVSMKLWNPVSYSALTVSSNPSGSIVKITANKNTTGSYKVSWTMFMGYKFYTTITNPAKMILYSTKKCKMNMSKCVSSVRINCVFLEQCECTD